MTWYYALGNERQGPIDDAALDRLIATGVVTRDTLVWKAGMADWQPLAQARPQVVTPPTPVIPPPPAATTPAAGIPLPSTQPRIEAAAGTFTPAATPTPGAGAYGGGYGAAAGAGAAAGGWSAPRPSGPADADQLYARVVSEHRTLAIGDILGRAWQLVMDNLGLAIGGTAIFIISNLLGAIPCLGILITLAVTPIL